MHGGTHIVWSRGLGLRFARSMFARVLANQIRHLVFQLFKSRVISWMSTEVRVSPCSPNYHTPVSVCMSTCLQSIVVRHYAIDDLFHVFFILK